MLYPLTGQHQLTRERLGVATALAGCDAGADSALRHCVVPLLLHRSPYFAAACEGGPELGVRGSPGTRTLNPRIKSP
ncbi:MAG TPA: hypothetical protein VHJ83_08590, partial [Micromonosporaceae bacterium]|nr:hypothetical protein [Micromonosporaceae bacterium]